MSEHQNFTKRITDHRIPRDLKRGNDDAAKIQNEERQLIKLKTIKKTKKLKKAVQVLSGDEGYSDTSEEAWFIALQKGTIKTEAIYKAMQAFGLKWDAMQGYWYTRARRAPFIKTMFTIVRRIDDRLSKE